MAARLLFRSMLPNEVRRPAQDASPRSRPDTPPQPVPAAVVRKLVARLSSVSDRTRVAAVTWLFTVFGRLAEDAKVSRPTHARPPQRLTFAPAQTVVGSVYTMLFRLLEYESARPAVIGLLCLVRRARAAGGGGSRRALTPATHR